MKALQSVDDKVLQAVEVLIPSEELSVEFQNFIKAKEQ